MAYPPGFLDELRSRLLVSEVIGRRVKVIRAGREFKACCPFHKEKTPSFTINDQKGFYHCFGCGAHGDVIGFTMRQENRSFPEAVEFLAGLAGMQVPQSSPEEVQRYEKEKGLHALIEDAARWFEEQLHGSQGRAALDYLRGRKLADDTIARFRLGYSPNDGQSLITHLTRKGYAPEQMVEAGLAKKAEGENRIYSFFRGRVMFPVGDRRGRVVAFGGRILEGDGPKYINSADHSLFHKGQLLYGFSRARAAAAEGKPIIIGEGYMDVIRLVEAGFSGAVAPLGTALTEEQMLLLWKIIPRPPVRPELLNHIPILCFDGDAAGLQAAGRALERILPHLAADQSVRFALMNDNEDPDSLILKKGPAAMQAVLDQALPLVEFLWRTAAANRPLTTPEDRAGFRRALQQYVAQIKDVSLQRDYQNDIRQKLQESFGGGSNDNRYEGRRDFQTRRDWKNERYRNPSTFAVLGRPRPLPDHLQEQIVLALLINHPALFPEMEVPLDNLLFADTDMERLRRSIFDYMNEEGAVPQTLPLREYLEAHGHDTTLKKILSTALYVHAGFAREGKPFEMARAGWHDIWHRHAKRQLEDELRNASLELNHSSDSAILQRIEELQALLREMELAHDQEGLSA
jgi:DNA primase